MPETYRQRGREQPRGHVVPRRAANVFVGVIAVLAGGTLAQGCGGGGGGGGGVAGDTISTVAGLGSPGLSGDGGAAVAAALSDPQDVAVDTAGNLYIADTGNNRIRKVDAAGKITTLASGLDDPVAVAVNAAGDVFFAEPFTHRVRKVVAATGAIMTVAGTGTGGGLGSSGDGGPAVHAQLSGPVDLAVDASGNVFILEELADRVRRVDAGTGVISTIVGAVGDLTAVAVDAQGSVFYADNVQVHRLDPASGTATRVAGTSRGYGGDGGPATQALLDLPIALAMDASGHLFITDRGNERIRRVDARTGVITTITGTGVAGFSGDGGRAAQAQINRPWGLAFGPNGALFVADRGNHRIRRIGAAQGGGTGSGRSWTEAAAAAPWIKRSGHSAAFFGGKVWVLGGNDAAQAPLSDVWSSSTGANWTLETDTPGWSARTRHGAVVHGGKMWVVGGTDGGGLTHFGDVWSSSDGVSWSLVTAAPGWSPREDALVLSHGGELFVIGGWDDTFASLTDVWSSPDGVTWTQRTAAAPFAAPEGLVGASFAGRLWVLGGFDGANESTHVYSSSDGATWTLETTSPGWQARSHGAAVVFASKLWILAGFGHGGGPLNDVYSSTDGKVWTVETAAAPWAARFSPAVAASSSRLWVPEAMVLRLFRRGARHLVDVQHLSDIAVTVEREPPPGEEGERETIRWTGKLDRMLWLGELTRTDYLIVGVVAVAPRTQEARLYKEISAEEGQRYEQEVAAYRATLEAMGTKLLADHTDYDRRVNAAINEYDRALNSYRQRAPSRYKLDQAALEGPREALRARRVAIATEVEQRLGDIEARLGALRPLSAWATDARSEEKLVTVHYADLAVRVRLLETRTGRIVWVHEARLRSRDPARGVAALLDDVAERLIPSG